MRLDCGETMKVVAFIENPPHDCTVLDESPVEGRHSYVYLVGISLKRSWNGEVSNVSVLVAVAGPATPLPFLSSRKP